jgi:hypothetical protein
MSNALMNGKSSPADASPPAPTWEQLAAAGRLADAIAAYVAHYDWTTFAELCRRLQPYFETNGEMAMELRPNVVLWCGVSQAFADAVVGLVRDHRVYLHPCTTLSYMVDGGILPMPLAKFPPASGYRRPHWLPVALRTVPIRTAKDKGAGRVRAIEPRRKAVRS